MEIEAIRGLLARHPGPYELRMADGSVVHVTSPEFVAFPPPSLPDARTIVVYGPGQFDLLDALMIVAAGPVPPNGANGSEQAPQES